jgi:hypothetical protein
MRHLPPVLATGQRGAATVVVTLVLLGAMLLLAVFANRGLLLEARMSANQARSTIAFEAAEAGLEWALVQLNGNARTGADCRPDTGGTTSFRERYLSMNDSPSGFTGRVAGASGAPLRPACTRNGAGWVCSCPTDGPALLNHEDATAAFVVEFLPGRQQGVVRIVATGSAAGADATARVEASAALLPALASAPAAALTARGHIDAGSASIGAHNADPASAGVALHAGGMIAAGSARFTVPAGATLANVVAGNDAALAALDGDRLFVSYFGLPKPAWSNQPTARRVDCAGDCTADLAAAIGSEVTNPLIWIGGDATIEGPVTLGRADRPVAIVVDGRLQLRGAVSLHGVAYANGIAWTGNVSSGAQVQGALVSESGYAGDAAPDLHRDAAVLTTLMRRTGSFVRVAGSWRDF